MFWRPKFPAPPSLEELQAATPRIDPVPDDGSPRPFWSVMIPTYNCANYLRSTLEGVLAQDPGSEQMQIEVIDDCSTKDDPESVVQKLGRGRVNFFRHQQNQGATNTFNTCIKRSRGHWVHILHGDDKVLPGFYKAYQKHIEYFPEVVMVTGKVVTIDEDENWLNLCTPGNKTETPLLNDFISRQAVDQLGCFPAVVVKRESYEKVGGFCSWYVHTADMDMWFRVGCLGPVGCLAQAYALYRKHSASDTNKLMISGFNIQEKYITCLVNIERIKQLFPNIKVDPDWKERTAEFADYGAWALDRVGSTEGRLNQTRLAWALSPSSRRLINYAKSLIKHKLR